MNETLVGGALSQWDSFAGSEAVSLVQASATNRPVRVTDGLGPGTVQYAHTNLQRVEDLSLTPFGGSIEDATIIEIVRFTQMVSGQDYASQVLNAGSATRMGVSAGAADPTSFALKVAAPTNAGNVNFVLCGTVDPYWHFIAGVSNTELNKSFVDRAKYTASDGAISFRGPGSGVLQGLRTNAGGSAASAHQHTADKLIVVGVTTDAEIYECRRWFLTQYPLLPDNYSWTFVNGQSWAVDVMGYLWDSFSDPYLQVGAFNKDASGLYVEWAPGTPLRTELMARLAAMPRGVGVTKSVVIWFGAKDAILQASADAFEANLALLISNMRSTVQDYTMRAILPQLSIHTNLVAYPYRDTVRAAIAAVAASDVNAVLIDNDDLPLPDGVHYSAAGYATISQRIHAALP